MAMTSNRLEAFSDGVFAVAITILIFNLQGPRGAAVGLGRALLAQWPSYAGYVVSFLTIGIIWVNHHGLFRRVRRIDRRILFLNLILLMVVAFLPFPTALVGEYVLVAGAATLVTALYGSTMILLSLSFLGIWAYVSFRDGFLASPVDPGAARAQLPWFGLGLLGYTLAIAVAFVSAPLSLAIDAVMAVYYVFDHLPVPDREPVAATGSEAPAAAIGDDDAMPAPATGTPGV